MDAFRTPEVAIKGIEPEVTLSIYVEILHTYISLKTVLRVLLTPVLVSEAHVTSKLWR